MLTGLWRNALAAVPVGDVANAVGAHRPLPLPLALIGVCDSALSVTVTLLAYKY
jgi:hypothetical protein